MFTKKPYNAIGTMSGTSLDGVDVAQIITDGEAIFEFGDDHYRAYSDAERSVLHDALGKWHDDDVAAAYDVVQSAHAQAVTGFSGDIVGFHGQTLAHDPRGRGTHQLGDGQALAKAIGMPVAWDFRSDDVRLGGQGAPLAPFFHHAVARYVRAAAPVAILNLGGVGNITFVDPRIPRPELAGALLAFDTGPANAPINDLMRRRRGVDFDRGGALAATGQVAQGALELFLQDPFFRKIPPKSLDRDAFAVMVSLVDELSDADAVATLTAMVAASVMVGFEHAPAHVSQLWVTGGGRHNPVIMQMLSAALDCDVLPIETVGLNGDMLEAQAFAYLAVRVARGLPTSCPTTTGVPMVVGGGIVSHPN